jgi:hypothetical protein
MPTALRSSFYTILAVKGSDVGADGAFGIVGKGARS